MQVCLSYVNVHYFSGDQLTNYLIGECTLNNIASFLPEKKHAKLSSMQRTGENIIMKFVIKHAKF